MGEVHSINNTHMPLKSASSCVVASVAWCHTSWCRKYHHYLQVSYLFRFRFYEKLCSRFSFSCFCEIPSTDAVWGVGLQHLDFWDCGFESRWGHFSVSRLRCVFSR